MKKLHIMLLAMLCCVVSANAQTIEDEEGETVFEREQTDEQGLIYTLKSDDSGVYYSVTGHTDEMNSEIVIPADLGGCPVRTIEDGERRHIATINGKPLYIYPKIRTTFFIFPKSMTIGDTLSWHRS